MDRFVKEYSFTDRIRLQTRAAPHIPEKMEAIEPSAAQEPLGLDLPISNEGEMVSRPIFEVIQQLLHELNQLQQEVKNLRESFRES